jgi:UDP-perosamine 4-acetyltransferase
MTTSRDIVVVGAGGHAKVCIELLRAGGHHVAFCVGSSDSDPECLGTPVLFGDDHLDRLYTEGFRHVFIAIGSNRGRIALAGMATGIGFELVSAVSPNATVSPTATLGKGVAVMAGAVINACTEIGDLAIVNTGATIDHDCIIGAGSHIAPGSTLAGNVTVGVGAFLGVGTRVIPQRTIGEHAQVGAGGVIVRDIPPGVLAMGVPARIVEPK